MSALPRFWQTRSGYARLLWPVSQVYGMLLWLRRWSYRLGLQRSVPSPLPVIVVGNLSVGGTGKTPLCAELVRRFAATGWKPAIVSRGYGGTRHIRAHLVCADDTPESAGDEPVMLYRQTGVPVCVCVDRAAAVACVSAKTDADIVFSDDGLQHLRMQRVADIVVIDGIRGLGNRWVMPAGPLREPCSRMACADMIAIQMPFSPQAPNGQAMHPSVAISLRRHAPTMSASLCFRLQPGALRHLRSERTLALSDLPGTRVHAVAGIGNPGRFFDSLQASGLTVQAHPKPDHHVFVIDDLCFDDELPVLITSKDAVKLSGLPDLPATVYEVTTRIRTSVELDKAIDALERSLREPGKLRSED